MARFRKRRFGRSYRRTYRKLRRSRRRTSRTTKIFGLSLPVAGVLGFIAYKVFVKK